VSTKTQAKSLLTDEVAQLRSLVEEQQKLLNDQRLRLAALEAKDSNDQDGSANGDGNGHINGNERHSRRDLLRMAGMAAAGAAGAVGVTALQTLPAAAATSGNFTLGVANNADAPTILNPTVAAPTAANAPGLLDVDGSITSGATPNLPVNATANFFRSVRGIAPLTPALGPSGVGVWGTSDAGAGVVGSSSTGVDFWAFNSGRVMQSAQPAGSPTYQGGVYDTTLTTPAWTDFEVVRDQNGIVWVFLPNSLNGASIAPGTALGTWVPLQPGGIGVNSAGPTNSKGALFSAVTTKLLMLQSSDGNTFQDMMPDGSPGIGLTGGPDLVMDITPAFNCLALITGSADLYTDTSGVNQDIGIYVSPSSASQNIVAWKESGGSAGVNSPNAAFVQAVLPMTRGTAYNVRMKWKTNNAQPAGAHIRAGAGPFPRNAGLASVSPTRLTALLFINP
jgi:hypothetical protein